MIHIVAPVLGPIALVNARLLIASGVLLLYAVLTGPQRPAFRTSWKEAFLFLAALNSVLPLMLEAMAVMYLNASLTAILAITTPLFATLIATVWLHERLTLRKGLGLLLSLLGVRVLVGWSPVPLTCMTILAVGAALLASLLYASGIYAKLAFKETPALPLAIGQELAAGLLLVPQAVATPPPTMPTPGAIVATMILALIMTACGNLLHFSLIRRVGPTKIQTVLFLIPVFALTGGVLFLGEPFTRSVLLGLTRLLSLWGRIAASALLPSRGGCSDDCYSVSDRNGCLRGRVRCCLS